MYSALRGPNSGSIVSLFAPCLAAVTWLSPTPAHAETVDWRSASSLLASISVDAPVQDAAVTSDGALAYVAATDRLLVIDLLTGTQIAEVLDVGAFGIDFVGGNGNEDCVVVAEPLFQILRRFDVSNPANPIQVGLDPAGPAFLVSSDGVDDDGILASSTGMGVQIFDASDCGTPAVGTGSRGDLTVNDLDVWKSSSLLPTLDPSVVLAGPDYLVALDDNADQVMQLALIFTPQEVRAKVLDLYFTGGDKVTKVNITDPANPVETGTQSIPGAGPLELSGDNVMVAAGNTISVLDDNLVEDQELTGNADISQIFGNEDVPMGEANGVVVRNEFGLETFRWTELGPIAPVSESPFNHNSLGGSATHVVGQDVIVSVSLNDTELRSRDGSLLDTSNLGGHVVNAENGWVAALRSGELRTWEIDPGTLELNERGNTFVGTGFMSDIRVDVEGGDNLWVGASTTGEIAWGGIGQEGPSVAGTFTGPIGLSSVDIEGNTILAAGSEGWVAYNVSDPGNVQELASGSQAGDYVALTLDLSGDADLDGIVSNDDFVGFFGINFDGTSYSAGDIDIDSGDDIREFETLTSPPALTGTATTTLYLSSESRVLAYDITDPSQSEYLGSYTEPNLFLRGLGVGADGVYAIRPDGATGLPMHAPGATTDVEQGGFDDNTVNRGVDLKAHPNPSHGFSTLSWASEVPVDFELTVHDAAGRWIRRVASGVAHGSLEAHWDGKDAGGRPVPAGVYYVHLRAGTEENPGRIIPTSARSVTLLR